VRFVVHDDDDENASMVFYRIVKRIPGGDASKVFFGTSLLLFIGAPPTSPSPCVTLQRSVRAARLQRECVLVRCVLTRPRSEARPRVLLRGKVRHGPFLHQRARRPEAVDESMRAKEKDKYAKIVADNVDKPAAE